MHRKKKRRRVAERIRGMRRLRTSRERGAIRRRR